ncbi:MAG: HAD family phosphatase [Betaproteobacteria bacterium]|nr:MAG: HAD family phosphatase [Betaproteobacteria bacterium]
MENIAAVIFDLGKVLLDWNPAYFYAAHFPDDSAGLERFLTAIVTPAWIAEMDAGKPASTAMAELSARHPDHAHLIGLWQTGWPHMLRGEIGGTVDVLAELRARGLRLYSLTNFSVETYPVACARFPFLDWFEHAVVSGEVGLVKPDRRIFELAIARCRIEPGRSVFIDDMPANVAAAKACGLNALQFTTPSALRASLRELGLLGG